MIPGFRQLVWLRSRSVPLAARSFWRAVAALRFEGEDLRALERVESVRRNLESDSRGFDRVDLGVGPSRPSEASEQMTVGQLAKSASVTPAWGRLLFSIARVGRSTRILELGSCTGLSAAYLQLALDLNGGGQLVTIEGDPFLCQIARETLATVSPDPGEVVEGSFETVLSELLPQQESFDLVFIDGHHDPTAARAYYRMIVPHLTTNGLIILDDIQPFTGAVRPAWKTLVSESDFTWAVDLIRMGVIQPSFTQ